MEPTKNVINKYANWTTDLIREDVQKNTFPYACLMVNIEGDFNMSSVFRNGNAFGCSKLFYHGQKKWDKRGAVGIYNYSFISHLSSLEDVRLLKEKYTLIALECGEGEASYMRNFKWNTEKEPCIVVGAECGGISRNVLEMCDHVVEIPMYGSVRSINAATAAGIAMCDLVTKRYSSKNL